ncbi:MAG: glycoside hydrolase family 3 C-terminal domain-containing protein [Mucilaginibacter sp.]|uniref:beta-glucosidase n=1 Tax=Mucilaginibacter sp. TaxID=1882438 RepID=UPI003267321A
MKKILVKFCACIFCAAISSGAFAQVYKDPKKPVEDRVSDMLSNMTLDEKLNYIGGYNGFYIRGISRLGLPEIKLTDGPVGVHKDGRAIAYPATILTAATWDTSLVNQLGYQLGRDARARGAHILLAPGVNIYRAPMAGRSFEYMGEDPYLVSRLAVNYIKGVQQAGVVATVKHFAANNQEWDRNNISSDIDERTLQEIYFPAFKAAVMEAHVGAVMNSYNLINGQHATQSNYLNNVVLKKDWHFDGVLMSDWDATYDGRAAANAGLDLEMPYAKFMSSANLLSALNKGEVKQSVIDDKVARILRLVFKNGFYDHQQKDNTIPKNNPDGQKVALELAKGGIVLLKNQGKLLPLSKTVKTIAVIGPNANTYIAGGGSSYTFPFSFITALQGIKKNANGVKVVYVPGIPPFSDLVSNSKFYIDKNFRRTGLKATYFNNSKLDGIPVKVAEEQNVNIHNGWGVVAENKGVPYDHTSIRWTGYVKPKLSGRYQFTVRGFDGFRLWINDKKIIDAWQDQGITSKSASMLLDGNKPYAIKLEYYANTHPVDISFAWGIEKINYQDAIKAAKKADIAFVCAGFNESTEKESVDRTFGLPAGQDELISAIAKANRNTVVVLNAGGGVSMAKWITNVKSILYPWYPGQEGGEVIADIIFGKTNPSGHLPISIEKSWSNNPVYKNYYDTTGSKRINYKEGVFLGYRFYDSNITKPLFPFGYGLSYTNFSYDNLNVKVTDSTTVDIHFTIKNTGKYDGAEVSQVYVRQINCPVLRPYKELKAFAKTFIKKGESKDINIRLNRSAFEYYSAQEKKFKHDPGMFELLIGSSSADISLKNTINIK